MKNSDLDTIMNVARTNGAKVVMSMNECALLSIPRGKLNVIAKELAFNGFSINPHCGIYAKVWKTRGQDAVHVG
jgi:hypothetical protein